ncbi:MAG: PKD domain-containing protein, partial [Crocinitomicaceae bacterium]|nr:PKD domain-containing protein [Crocinitomicaceae bacterium]
MKFKYLIIFLIVSFASNARASHIVGGDIYYNYLGANNYEFHVSLYRDCLSTGAQYDSPLNLTVYNNGILIQNLQVPFPGSITLPVVFNNPCVTPPTNICTEHAEYVVVVNLPPAVGGYDVSYQRCCRGPNITNLVNPDDTGITLTCHVPGFDTGEWENSSPRFTNYPPLLLCNNEDLDFDHSATDPDGDVLAYSLVTPFAGASSFNPQPNQAPPPTYPPVNWAGGFGSANPLGPGASISINPTTGQLIASPSLLGLFVVGIQVQEIRNGVVINQTTRDFLFRVFNCNLQLESILPEQDELATFVSYCNGLTVNFENNSYGGTNYAWDFGVLGINTDVSSAFAPSYTYPAPGSYTAMLIVNPGWPCTDTAYMDIVVNNELEITWLSQDSLCFVDNEFDFVANGGPPGIIYDWNFGPNATPATGVGSNVDGVSFSTSGLHSVTVNGTFSLCAATWTSEVYVMPAPTAEMILVPDIECAGLNIYFGNNTINATNYNWDFSGLGSSSDFDPTFAFPEPGTYTVTLSAWSSLACMDIVEETFDLNELIVVDFNTAPSGCLTENSFDFDGTVSGPVGTFFSYNFGPNASIPSSTDIDVFNVSFTAPGTIPITLTGTFENCIQTTTQEIYIYSPPTIDFALEPELQCVPFNAQFIDQSWAETQIFYNWNFGDGGSSTDQNPSHIYNNVGGYPVTLTIYTTEGCIDTLTFLQADIIDVHPNPEAEFSV